MCANMRPILDSAAMQENTGNHQAYATCVCVCYIFIKKNRDAKHLEMVNKSLKRPNISLHKLRVVCKQA